MGALLQNGVSTIMAIDQGTETVSISTQERTWRINIETPLGQTPVVTAFREIIKADSGGTIFARAIGIEVSRLADAVATEKFTAAGATVTGAQLAALISKAVDQWRQQDIDAVKPVAGA